MDFPVFVNIFLITRRSSSESSTSIVVAKLEVSGFPQNANQLIAFRFLSGIDGSVLLALRISL